MISKENIIQRHFGKLITAFDEDEVTYRDWRTKYYNMIGEVITYDIGNNEKMVFFFMSDDIWFHTSVVKDIFAIDNKVYYKTFNSTYEFELVGGLSYEDREYLSSKGNEWNFMVGYEKL